MPMKHLIKFAIGAAIAGALVNMLIKQRAGGGMEARDEGHDQEDEAQDTAGFTVEELTAENPQSDDLRSVKNVLNS
jgi:hypothetical protein